MKIEIITIGKLKQPAINELEQDYLKRLPRPFQLSIIELPKSNDSNPQVVKKVDTQSAIKRIDQMESAYFLDESGRKLGSTELASRIQEQMLQFSKLYFLIGGAHGWDKDLIPKSATMLSLSKMTLPYQLARLVLVEQLYRSISIINGTKYHKS